MITMLFLSNSQFHALTKHAAKQRLGGTRGNGAFPPLKGNNQAINNLAQQQIDDILTHPQSVFQRLPKGGLEVRIPDGRGIRFNADNSFHSFID
jgi:filamentous hemagglutinin